MNVHQLLSGMDILPSSFFDRMAMNDIMEIAYKNYKPTFDDEIHLIRHQYSTLYRKNNHMYKDDLTVPTEERCECKVMQIILIEHSDTNHLIDFEIYYNIYSHREIIDECIVKCIHAAIVEGSYDDSIEKDDSNNLISEWKDSFKALNHLYSEQLSKYKGCASNYTYSIDDIDYFFISGKDNVNGLIRIFNDYYHKYYDENNGVINNLLEQYRPWIFMAYKCLPTIPLLGIGKIATNRFCFNYQTIDSYGMFNTPNEIPNIVYIQNDCDNNKKCDNVCLLSIFIINDECDTNDNDDTSSSILNELLVDDSEDNKQYSIYTISTNRMYLFTFENGYMLKFNMYKNAMVLIDNNGNVIYQNINMNTKQSLLEFVLNLSEDIVWEFVLILRAIVLSQYIS